MTTFQTPSLSHIRVHEAMHPGIISVSPETPLRTVAQVMTEHRVHALAISSAGEDAAQPPGIVSALDVVAAAAWGEDRTAGELAATELVTVSSSERLDHAARLMAEHDLSHLIVTDAASGLPTGVLSTLDVLSACGA
jgi:predicted transcriptional regulator